MNFTEYEKIIADWSTTKLPPVSDLLKAGQTPENFKNKYFPYLLTGFKEVSDPFEAIKFSLELLNSEFPSDANKEKYLNFIIHTFLNDCYILKEMLKAYANKLIKLYGEPSKTVLKPLFEGVVSLEPLMKKRNSHVHQARFTGGGLGELNSISLAAIYNSSLQETSDEVFKVTLGAWIKYIEGTIAIFTDLLDDSFTCISEVVIRDGMVFEPEQ